MELSCGVIVTNGDRILIQHPTGKSWEKGNWDIPKGHIEQGELEVDCALRELQEETGIIARRELLVYVGKFAYTEKKNLSLFLYQVNFLPELERMFCKSKFIHKKTGKEIEEVNGYRYILLSEIDYLFPKLQIVILNWIASLQIK